jgi:hypothetical protein
VPSRVWEIKISRTGLGLALEAGSSWLCLFFEFKIGSWSVRVLLFVEWRMHYIARLSP